MKKNLIVPLTIILGVSGCNSSKKEAEFKKPNIVFILADDMGYGDLSSYGATKVSTPNIDRIAKEGMKFANAYSPHSVCTPSRYALLTGRYAWRTWNGHATVWSNDPLLIDTTRVTLPKVLKSAGYHTALIGKWHLGFGAPGIPGWDDLKGPDYNLALKPGPLEVGFDYFYGVPHVGQRPHVFIENHHVLNLDQDQSMQIVLDKRWLNRTSYLERLGVPAHNFTGDDSARYAHEDLAVLLTEKAVDWIGKQPKEPFFLYLAHRNVHGPLRPHPRFQGTSEIGVYGDFINEFDWSVGEILNALDQNGLTENTIVFFASDNGGARYPIVPPSKFIEFNGHAPNGPFFGQKGEVYEGGVHVPLMVRWPGMIKQGSQSDALVSLSDVLATMAEMHQIPLTWNSAEDSYSFLHILTGKSPQQAVRDNVVVDSNKGLFAIRKGSWKFIAGQGGGGGSWDEENSIRMIPHKWRYGDDLKEPPGQLYNLVDDPAERTNLYEAHPEIVVPLNSLLREIMYGGRSR